MSTSVVSLDATNRPRWEEYVRRTPGSNFASRPAWRDLVEGWFGCPPDWRMAERDGQVVGILPLFEKRAGGRVRQLFSAPGGLLADDAEAAEALLAPARERVMREKLELLELRDQRQRWDGLETSEEHCTLILPLATEPEAQWRGFGDKLRNQVRKAQKSGLSVRWGREHLRAWHEVMLHNMRDLGTPFPGPDYFAKALDVYGGDAEIEVLEREGKVIGALAAVSHADGMVNPWASSLRAYRPMCPNHMLYWEAIQRAIARGLRWFDFGRSQWRSSTFDFKASWGAVPQPLFYQYVLGTVKAIPNLHDQKQAFEIAVRVWQKLPLPLARALGPIARRRFPEAL